MANPRRGDFEDSSYDISEDLTRKSYMHICTGLMNWTPFFSGGSDPSPESTVGKGDP